MPSSTPSASPAPSIAPSPPPSVAPLLSPSVAPSPAVSVEPSPSVAPARAIRLRFALPPLDGSISLGIYDAAGKLVRVLHREDAVTDFEAGHDALETSWDGHDDAGQALPNGKYHARGYVVGGLKVEGVDYFFNDWVTDENSPHFLRLTQLWMESGELLLEAEMPGGVKTAFVCDQTTGLPGAEKAAPTGVHCQHIPTLPNVTDCAEGREGTIWFIDSPDPQAPRVVKQVAPNREVLRRLEYPPTELQPERIEASPTAEKIFLLEQGSGLQRFRGLELVKTTTDGADGPVSDWKSFLEKKIVAHRDFSFVSGKPAAKGGNSSAAPAKISQKLRADPLQNDAPGKVELAVGIDEDGSYLQTADGLPLRTISDTPHLTRTVLSRPNDGALDVFQDDGAVVEQYRISNLAEMIAFDCGDFELK
ncbi:MAG: FlgD immunoglobulin-like domain containing protein [Spartobacteria bacterium]